MTTTRTAIDRHSLLSLLWLFVLLNFLYCDVLGLHDAGVVKSVLSGRVGDLEITPGFLFASGLLMEIPIAMVLLSRVLPRRGLRWLSIGAAGFMIVVQVASLFVGTTTGYYAFFSAIEIGGLAAVIIVAGRWRSDAALASREM